MIGPVNVHCLVKISEYFLIANAVQACNLAVQCSCSADLESSNCCERRLTITSYINISYVGPDDWCCEDWAGGRERTSSCCTTSPTSPAPSGSTTGTQRKPIGRISICRLWLIHGEKTEAQWWGLNEELFTFKSSPIQFTYYISLCYSMKTRGGKAGQSREV